MSKSDSSGSYRQELKIKILETAMRFFRQKGIKAVKMDDIASNLSISKRTLYELYDNKEDLLYECLRYHHIEFDKKLAARMESGSTVMDLLVSYMKLHIEETSKTNPLFFCEIGKYPKAMKFFEERNVESQELSVGFMKRGVDEGFFRNDVDIHIINLIADVFLKHILDNELYKKYPINVLFRSVIMVMLRGFCTSKGVSTLEKVDMLTTDNPR